MTIHTVAAGETVWSIAAFYGVDPLRLRQDNGVPEDGALAVGQALLVRFPQVVHGVRLGETLSGIARQYGVSVRQLLRRNWQLGGRTELRPGQTLVISYLETKLGGITTNGYAYPYIRRALLDSTLPYMSYLTPFSYGITESGGLLSLEDQNLLEAARSLGALPLMHLSSLTEAGQFSSQRSEGLIGSAAAQEAMTEAVVRVVEARGYQGVDADFEYIPAELADDYVEMIRRLRQAMAPLGYPVLVALVPKTWADQPGAFYEAHDYAGLGAASDGALVMTYEWGFTYGAPMAVSPLPNVRAVLDYAVTEIPPEKILMGMSNYGYDWTLPFRQGVSKARSLSTEEAVALAVRYGAEILYDETSAAPWFRYTDEGGAVHEVWFEDCRSWAARLRLVAEYGLMGVGIWNLMRQNPQAWNTLDALYEVDDLAGGPA